MFRNVQNASVPAERIGGNSLRVPSKSVEKPKSVCSRIAEEKRCLKEIHDGLTVSLEHLQAASDLTKLPVLYPQTVMDCIRERFYSHQFYTWAGPTLVAVNPCHPVPQLYSVQQVKDFHCKVNKGESPLPPHVYAVAGMAEYRRRCDLGKTNQAVVVSGESGAGKTESARYMLSYLCQAEDLSRDIMPLVKSFVVGIVAHTQNQVLASNPLLEAFGNAGTLRNHNSSRFGKLLQLQYFGPELRGAVIETYLLEKTRVTHQPQGERNFHIMHQVLAGIHSGLLDDNGCRVLIDEVNTSKIESFRDYGYLSQPDFGQMSTVESKYKICPFFANSDIDGLKNTLAAMSQLNIEMQHVNNILKLVVALLHLGNVEFCQNIGGLSECHVIENSSHHLLTASEMLGVTFEQLHEALTVRVIAVPAKERVSVFKHNCECVWECERRLSACMQLLYHGLFSHIVKAVNDQISATLPWLDFIGLLDVYGFEVFEHNSLEQLCINYANERLQQAFTQTFLHREQQELLEEGILVDACDFIDNTGCLKALHSPVSVFAILNEECQLLRPVDEVSACERVCRALQDSQYVSSPTAVSLERRPVANVSAAGYKTGRQVHAVATDGFVVRHYAGPVHYSAQGLLTKNKDLVPVEVLTMLAQSDNDFIAGLLDEKVCHGLVGTNLPASNSPCTETGTPCKLFERWNSSPVLSSSGSILTTSKSCTPSDTGLSRRPNTPTPASTPVSSMTGSMRRTARRVTTLSKFKSSLDSLLSTLDLCDLHYVRCVKPNILGQSGLADDDYLMSQLSACGILDTVTISQAGFPVRMLFEDFSARYGCHCSAESDAKQDTVAVMQAFSEQPQAHLLYKIGIRRVFLSEQTFRQLESLREERRNCAACFIQNYWRRYVCMRDYAALRVAVATVLRCAAAWKDRRNFLKLKQAAVTVQKHERGRRERTRYKAIRSSTIVIQKFVKGWLVRRQYENMKTAVIRLQSQVRRLLAVRTMLRIKAQRAEQKVKERRAAVAWSPVEFSMASTAISLGYQTASLSLPSFATSQNTPSPDSKLVLDSLCSNGCEIKLDEPKSLQNTTSTCSIFNDVQASLLDVPVSRLLIETEESGIETDTESLSGERVSAGTDCQAGVRRRRRSKVMRLSETGQDLSAGLLIQDMTDGSARNRLTVSNNRGDISRSSQQPDKEAPLVPPGRPSGMKVTFDCKHVPTNVTVRKKRRYSLPLFDPQNNVVTISKTKLIRNVLSTYSTNSDVQFVYSSEKANIYFRQGIASYRRTPLVHIRFHTKTTCLPYSFHLPKSLQPQGLVDALG